MVCLGLLWEGLQTKFRRTLLIFSSNKVLKFSTNSSIIEVWFICKMFLLTLGK